MLDYEKVIPDLKKYLPEFTFPAAYEESPILVFSVLASYINYLMKADENDKLNQCVAFLNELADSDETILDDPFDELGYSLKELSNSSYEIFLEKLSDKAASLVRQREN